MKNLLLTSATLLVLGSAPSLAADLAARPYAKAPPIVAAPAYYDWSGFYIGGNGGYGTSRKCYEATSFVLGVNVAPIADGCHDATGAVAGGQIGYRWQAATWVFGLEAQYDWADLKGSSLSTPLVFGPGFSNRTKIESLGLYTAQVGYAWNNVLLYVKGGAASTQDKYAGLVTATGAVFDRANETRWGGAAGVGFEYGFAPNWSLALEYDHLFMGNRSRTFTSSGLFTPAGTFSRVENVRQDVDLITARLNWHFGMGNNSVVARY